MRRKIDPQVEQRRTAVAELLLARPGVTVRQVARHFNVSVGTAYNDIRAVREEWAERRLHAYESRLVEDLVRTDVAIAGIWDAVRAGKGWAIDRLCSLIEQRMKLLGLNQTRHEVDVGDVLAKYLERIAGGDDGRAAD